MLSPEFAHVVPSFAIIHPGENGLAARNSQGRRVGNRRAHARALVGKEGSRGGAIKKTEHRIGIALRGWRWRTRVTAANELCARKALVLLEPAPLRILVNGGGNGMRSRAA